MPPTDQSDESKHGKGEAFFKRADEVAATGNWDFAIEMYLEGISRDPENIERGHQKLREVSMKRTSQGGKPCGMMETLKRRPGKDPIQNLINAEYLLANEPGSVALMIRVLEATAKLDLSKVALWMGDTVLESQRQASKPSKQVLMLLAEMLNRLEAYGKAIQTCELLNRSYPGDEKVGQMLKDLSARYTIQKGKYDQEDGDFTKSVKDMGKQNELVQQDSMVKSKNYLGQQIERARQEYEAQSTVPGKINAFVDAMLKIEDDAHESEAIEVLLKARKDTGAFQFQSRVGDIRIRQMTRKYRELLAAGDKAGAAQQARKQLDFELVEFASRAGEYPTDMGLKYELGRRQFLAGKYDEAISSLQQAQRDPRRHLAALTYLGRAFARKNLFTEAAETYERALGGELTEDREKELRYDLGVVLMEMGKYTEARDQFSQVAQMDYNYRDVRTQLGQADEKAKAAGAQQ